LFHILEETFEDPPQPGQGNVYLDKQTGWVQTLDGVSAERASRPVAPGGTTVAAQVGHARYYLEVAEGFMRGREPTPDWPGSWRVQEVTPEAWEELKTSLMSTYQRVAELLRTTEHWDDDRITDALAVLVHSAYHLGAVRQMLRLV
jgi:hypothetical protein